MRKSFLFMTMVFLGVAACTPASTPLPTGTAPPASPSSTPPPEVTSTPDDRPSTTGPVLVYQRVGGFAGLTQTWDVYADGRVVLDDGESRKTVGIDPAQVDELLRTVETLGFFELQDDFMPENTCCDRFFYTLTVQTGGMSNTIETVDDAPGVPEAVWEILSVVDETLPEIPL